LPSNLPSPDAKQNPLASTSTTEKQSHIFQFAHDKHFQHATTCGDLQQQQP
jgi:hypothetical protein